MLRNGPGYQKLILPLLFMFTYLRSMSCLSHHPLCGDFFPLMLQMGKLRLGETLIRNGRLGPQIHASGALIKVMRWGTECLGVSTVVSLQWRVALTQHFPDGTQWLRIHLQCLMGPHLWSLDGYHPLEKEMATHSSIIVWEIPWTEEAWWATVLGGHKEWDMT